jgi:phage terminase large subunit
MTEYIYKPSAWGEEFHSLPHDEALGAGAAGPGKTMVLLMEPTQQIAIEHQRCIDQDHPHHLQWGMSCGWALHLRRNYKSIEQTIARTQRIFPLIDPKARYDTKSTTWHFATGYRYQFGHCHTRDDWEQYLSNEYSIICYDELVEFDEEQYDQINTRLRSSDPVLRKMLKVRSMSNPVMTQGAGTRRDPYWVRKRFVEPARSGRKTLKRPIYGRDGKFLRNYTWIYLPATLYDNPNPDFVKDYEQRLASAKPHIRQALLYGDWYLTVSSYYADVWSDNLHVCSPFKVPDDWPVFRSMDWGFKSPGCVHWWALDPDSNLYCIRELTFQGKTDAEVAGIIQDIERKLGYWRDGRSAITGVADTQLWEERGEAHGKTKAQTFADCGVQWLPADKRRRGRNAELCYKRLQDHHGGTTTPGLVFFRSCEKAIENIKSIETDRDNPDVPSDEGADHWHDSVLYACAYASQGRVGRAREEDDEDDEDEDAEEARGRGKFGYG